VRAPGYFGTFATVLEKGTTVLETENMEDFRYIVHNKELIGFVATAKEFCDLVESPDKGDRRTFLSKLQKALPLIYLTGCSLPDVESNATGTIAEVVAEEDYNLLHVAIRQLMGADDEYLEVFDENMQYSDAPVIASISENVCDIYQDLKNFISSYQQGTHGTMQEALWQLNASFELYWGRTCVNVLRAVHAAVFQTIGEEV
jgi:hypothetical protein